jgi:hypothetical protein
MMLVAERHRLLHGDADPDTYGDRTNAPTAQPMPARMKTAPKMLTLARTLVLRWKI